VVIHRFGNLPDESFLVFVSKTLRSLLDYLSTHISLSDEKDAARPFHPHITLVNRDISETDFDLVWGEYAHKTFEAGFSVATISLLRKGEKRWEIVS
jgi:2'-5' RNA ligase